MTVILFGLLMEGVLSEEYIGYLLEIMERETTESKTNLMPHLSN